MSAVSAARILPSLKKLSPLKSCKVLSKTLKIEWDDGYQAEFPFCWLRDATNKRPALVHIDVNLKPEQVKVEHSKDFLQVQWPSYFYQKFVYFIFLIKKMCNQH